MQTLTKEQESIAFAEMGKGGPDGDQAREMFVYFNQPLIGSVARHYRGKGLSWEELISAGNVGLLKAITKYDPSRGLKFSTCAVPWISGEITNLFKKTKAQKLSDRRIRATENGVPLVDSVPDEEVIDGEDYADVQEAASPDAETSIGHALESLVGSDDTPPPSESQEETIEDQTLTRMGVDADLRPALEKAIERLHDTRQALVLRMRLGLNGHEQHTLAQIGQTLDISLQRVAVIEKAAFSELRKDPTLELLFELTQ